MQLMLPLVNRTLDRIEAPLGAAAPDAGRTQLALTSQKPDQQAAVTAARKPAQPAEGRSLIKVQQVSARGTIFLTLAQACLKQQLA